MKIVLQHLDKDLTDEVLFDSEKQYGMIIVEIVDQQFRIDQEGDMLYVNYHQPRGLDQLKIIPNASNAVNLGGNRR